MVNKREEGLDVTYGEVVESERDWLIQKRHDRRVAEEGGGMTPIG